MSAGSYVFSLQDRARSQSWNPKTASAEILKLFGKRSLTVNDLRSQTGMPLDLVEQSVTQLVDGGLLKSADNGAYQLTGRGYKAQHLVAG